MTAVVLSPAQEKYMAETDELLGLPVGMTRAQLIRESNFKPDAKSPKGALGVAQIMPEMVKHWSKEAGRQLDPKNIDDALLMHRMHMSSELDRFDGDPVSALKAYNAGPSGKNWNSKETRDYVKSILGAVEKNKVGGPIMRGYDSNGNLYDDDGNLLAFGGPINWDELGQIVEEPLSKSEATLLGRKPVSNTDMLNKALGITPPVDKKKSDDTQTTIRRQDVTPIPIQRDRSGLAGMYDELAVATGANVPRLTTDKTFTGPTAEQTEDRLATNEARQANMRIKGADLYRQGTRDIVGDMSDADKLRAALAQYTISGADNRFDKIYKTKPASNSDKLMQLYLANKKARLPDAELDEQLRNKILPSLGLQ